MDQVRSDKHIFSQYNWFDLIESKIHFYKIRIFDHDNDNHV